MLATLHAHTSGCATPQKKDDPDLGNGAEYAVFICSILNPPSVTRDEISWSRGNPHAPEKGARSAPASAGPEGQARDVSKEDELATWLQHSSDPLNGLHDVRNCAPGKSANHRVQRSLRSKANEKHASNRVRSVQEFQRVRHAVPHELTSKSDGEMRNVGLVRDRTPRCKPERGRSNAR